MSDEKLKVEGFEIPVDLLLAVPYMWNFQVSDNATRS